MTIYLLVQCGLCKRNSQLDVHKLGMHYCVHCRSTIVIVTTAGLFLKNESKDISITER